MSAEVWQASHMMVATCTFDNFVTLSTKENIRSGRRHLQNKYKCVDAHSDETRLYCRSDATNKTGKGDEEYDNHERLAFREQKYTSPYIYLRER